MQQEGTRFIAELTKGKNLIFIFKNKGNPLFKMAMKLFGATSFDHAWETKHYFLGAYLGLFMVNLH